MGLAAVRSVGSARSARGAVDPDDFEQELIDQYSLALSAVGITDKTASADRSTIFEFARFLGRPIWTASVEDVDRFLREARRERCLASSTVAG